jgi:hypothetical protein
MGYYETYSKFQDNKIICNKSAKLSLLYEFVKNGTLKARGIPLS